MFECRVVELSIEWMLIISENLEPKLESLQDRIDMFLWNHVTKATK